MCSTDATHTQWWLSRESTELGQTLLHSIDKARVVVIT
jgi:hypothetical protein